MTRQKYPLGMANFEKIRKEDYVYVDKTRYVHELASEGTYYFLARPRRFGKSLFLNTLEAYFQAKRDLFKGLAIDRLECGEWEWHPVLHLDLTGKSYTDRDSLARILQACMAECEERYGLEEIDLPFDERFRKLILTLEQRYDKKVVVLVDEYDSPLSDVIDNPALFQLYQQQLHGFYSVLKKTEKSLRFCMLTGVTKFGKVSVFSGLNNLRDITFNDAYAGICGITKEELYQYFNLGVERLARKMGISEEDVYLKLKRNYDGYHFSACLLDVYNPFSLLNVLADQRMFGYWCASGVPTLLSKVLKDFNFDFTSLPCKTVSQAKLENLAAYHTDPIALLYQTGYLTIKGYDIKRNRYTVGYPNLEVEEGLLENVLGCYMPAADDVGNTITDLAECLEEGDAEGFVKALGAFLSGIPFTLGEIVSRYERYYHTVMYCIMTLLGMKLKVDYPMAEGSPDVVVETPHYVYVMELKINGDASAAMRQIDERHYVAPFAADPRQVIKIGIGFSPAHHTVASFEIARIVR